MRFFFLWLGGQQACKKLILLEIIKKKNEGKVAIGKARYLLNIVYLHLDVQVISFPLSYYKTLYPLYYFCHLIRERYGFYFFIL
jgi:hypothetical protein